MEFYFYFPAELGEYDPQEHTMGYISEFRFTPNQVSTHYNSYNVKLPRHVMTDV